MSTNSKIGLRSFCDVVGDLAGGDFERQLTKELAEVGRAVDDTGKPGKLTITLSIAKDGKMIRVVTKSKAEIPREPIEATAFFTDGTGSLHKENPRQVKMPLQAVDAAGKDN